MFSNPNFVDYVIILSGVLLCFKRVAEMERYHRVRVVVLTSILSFFVVIFFLGHCLTFGSFVCTPPIQWDDTDTEHFTCTEM